MKASKWFVSTDWHSPTHDWKSLRAINRFLAENRFDGWLNLGDFMNFDEIAHFNKNTPRNKFGKSIERSYSIANELLDEQQSLIRGNNPDAEFVMEEGNHEYRVEKFIDERPEFEGFLEVEKNLRLKERGIKWVKSWSLGEIYRLGNAIFTHGRYLNKYHANKMVQTYGECVYYGHTHDVQEMPIVHLGADRTLVGKSLGCLCKYDAPYMMGIPSKWQQACAIFLVFPDKYFTEHTIRIFKHRFVMPDGKIYDGRKT